MSVEEEEERGLIKSGYCVCVCDVFISWFMTPCSWCVHPGHSMRLSPGLYYILSLWGERTDLIGQALRNLSNTRPAFVLRGRGTETRSRGKGKGLRGRRGLEIPCICVFVLHFLCTYFLTHWRNVTGTRFSKRPDNNGLFVKIWPTHRYPHSVLSFLFSYNL